MRIIRVHGINAPAVELISRTSANGANIAYWDLYAQPSDASFRIRDRQTGSTTLDRLTILHTNGNVGIGTITPSAKLHVINSSFIVDRGGNYISTGIFAQGLYNGLIGVAINPDDDGVGVAGSGGSIGVRGGSSEQGTGVQGTSIGSYGGSFTSYNGNGIFAMTTNGTYAGEFSGSVYASNGYFTTSDKNLKKNIQEFGDAMSIINKLKPQNYEFKNESKYASLQLPKGSHYGLMAQDLEQVLPSLVSEATHNLEKLNQ